MTQPTAATLHLTGDDYAVYAFRDWEEVVTLNKSTGPAVALDFSSGGDFYISSFEAEIRTHDAAETLICTGTPVVNSDGTDGKVLVRFPASGFPTSWTPDRTVRARWELVGLTPSGQRITLLIGDVDVRRTVVG